MFGRRTFSVAGLMTWNLLPDTVRGPTRSFDKLRRDLKRFSQSTSVYSALTTTCDYALYIFTTVIDIDIGLHVYVYIHSEP